MKKLLPLLFIFCITSGYAQTPISLDVNDLGTPVTSFVARTDTTVDVSITPGNPGINLTWNFQALHSTQDTLYIDVVNPATVPLHNLFPGSNLAIVYDHAINVYFFNRSASGLALYGIVNDFLKTGDSISVALTQPDTAIALPAHYGDSSYFYSYGDSKSKCNYTFDTNFGGFPVQVPIDTVRVKHKQYKNHVFDAWGTMHLPNSTFPALRQKDMIYSQDSIWGYAAVPAPYQSYSGWYFLTSRLDTTLTYSWWGKNYGVPAVKMTMAYWKSTVINDIEWAYDFGAGISENETESFSVFPNPANDYITVTNNGVYNEFIIYDASGKEISKMNIGNSAVVKASVNSLPDGLYFYNAINSKKVAGGKFIVKH